MEYYNSTELTNGYSNVLLNYIKEILLMMWCLCLQLDDQLLKYGLLCKFDKDKFWVLN